MTTSGFRPLLAASSAVFVLVTAGCTTTSKEPAPAIAAASTGSSSSAAALVSSGAADTSTATSAASPGSPTAPSAGSGGTVVVAVGDIACDPNDAGYKGGNGTASSCRQRATSDLAIGLKPAAVLVLGDLQYEVGKLAAFKESYDASWGRLKKITYPAPGNHEYGTGVTRGYFEYFGEQAGPAAKGYYSADVAGWHVVALNSNCAQVGGCQRGSAQEKWLRADLKAHPAACTIAIWHHPRWSSGLHGSSDQVDGLWRALAEAGADLVLVGHDHDYERFAPMNADGTVDKANGMSEFVVGTGGRSLYPMLGSAKGSELREAQTFGVLKLTLRPNAYDWAFVPVAGSSFADSGSGSCH